MWVSPAEKRRRLIVKAARAPLYIHTGGGIVGAAHLRILCIARPGPARRWNFDGPAYSTRVYYARPARDAWPRFHGSACRPLRRAHAREGAGPQMLPIAGDRGRCVSCAAWESTRERIAALPESGMTRACGPGRSKDSGARRGLRYEQVPIYRGIKAGETLRSSFRRARYSPGDCPLRKEIKGATTVL